MPHETANERIAAHRRESAMIHAKAQLADGAIDTILELVGDLEYERCLAQLGINEL